jgi:hypothetical protein
VNHNWHSENKHKRHRDLSRGSAKYNTCLVHVVASQWTRVALNSFQVIQWSTWIPRCSFSFTLSRLWGISTTWSLSPLQWDDHCWGLVLKCYELRTRQHKMLNDTVLRPWSIIPLRIMGLGRRLMRVLLRSWTFVINFR